jgi:hypothetical protein
MAFNLKEYILFREEIKRELFNVEVDENFKAVSNPWVHYRRYEIGQIVYHPITIEPDTGEVEPTGGGEEHLTWWRANTRTTLGVFDMTQWDIIGGIAGFTDITVAGSAGYGKIVPNWTAPFGLPWNAAADGLIEASGPNDTFRLAAGPGIGISWNAAQDAIQISNLGSIGEINNGINIGTAPGFGDTGILGPYNGMIGTDLSFIGLHATNNLGVSAGNILSALMVGTNLVYNVDQGEIDLASLNGGCPTLDLICDVMYTTPVPTAGDLLLFNGAEWQNTPASMIGSGNIYDTDSTFTTATRTATLNAGAGHLVFEGPGNTGLGIDNTGRAVSIGESATTFNSTLKVGENSAANFQIEIDQSGVGNAAIHYVNTSVDYIAGVSPGAPGFPPFTITEGTAFNGITLDDFSIESGNIWIPDWSLPLIVPIQDEHYIPFTAPQGASQGRTFTDAGFFWAYDGTDGTVSDSQALYINTPQLIGITKPGISLTNIPDNSNTQIAVGILSAIYPANALGGPVAHAWATHATTHDHNVAPTIAVTTWSGHYSELHIGVAGYEAEINSGSLATDVGVGFSSISDGDQLEQYGFTALWQPGSTAPSAKIGVFSDVVNTYSNTLNITEDGTWAGFFRGCVNIDEGGLVLAESATIPDCNILTGTDIEARTLWINSGNGHLYRGNKDLEDLGGSISLCELTDVDCSTPFTPSNGDLLVYDGGTDMWVASDPSTAGNNIYTVDGTLISERILDGDTFSFGLTFNNLLRFDTNAGTQTHIASINNYTITSAVDTSINAGGNIDLSATGAFPTSDINLTTTAGSINLLSQNAGGGITIYALDDTIWMGAELGISLQTFDPASNIDLTAADEINTSSYASTNIHAGDGQGPLPAPGGGYIYLDTITQGGADIVLNSSRAIELNAWNPAAPTLSANIDMIAGDHILLRVGPTSPLSDTSDYISIETWGVVSGATPTPNINYGSPLMRWMNTHGNEVTEYVDWQIPFNKGNYQDILAMKADLSGVEWINPAALTITELCGYDVECITPGPEGGDMLIFNGTTFTWTTAPAPSGLVTLYTGDDSLTNNRIADLDGHSLTFTDGICGTDLLTLQACTASGNIFGIGNLPTTGYTIPTSIGALGQILAVTSVGAGVNAIDWVDDSVFTLCDAQVNCPTGGPQNGEGLIYNSSTGMWEVEPIAAFGFWEEAGSTLNSLVDIKGSYTISGPVELSIIAGGTGHTLDDSGSGAQNNAIIGGNINEIRDSDNSIIGGGNNSSIDKESDGVAIFAATTSTIDNSTDSAIIGGVTNTIGTTSMLTVHNSIILGGTGNDMFTTGVDTVVQSAIVGGSSSIISASEDSAIIAGNSNQIQGSALRSVIIGGGGVGSGNFIGIGGISTDSVLLGGGDNNIASTGAVKSGAIIGGSSNELTNAISSVIIGGGTNVLDGFNNSVVIGGTGLAALADDTVYVPNLNINDTPATEPVVGLGLDVDNNVVLMGIAGEEICGESIDCPTGGPVAGDGLIFDGTNWVLQAGGAGYWEEGSALIDILGGHTVTGGSQTDTCIIAGGQDNKLIALGANIIQYSTILGGLVNEIVTTAAVGATSSYSTIIGGTVNTITPVTNGIGTAAIMGGSNNNITNTAGSPSSNNVIIGGASNTIDGFNNAVIIGGTSIIANIDDFVFVPALNIGSNINTPTTSFKLEDGSESLGHVLTSDAFGNANWQAVADLNGIYTGSGSLSGPTIVTQGTSQLNFESSGASGAFQMETVFIENTITGSASNIGLASSIPTNILNQEVIGVAGVVGTYSSFNPVPTYDIGVYGDAENGTLNTRPTGVYGRCAHTTSTYQYGVRGQVTGNATASGQTYAGWFGNSSTKIGAGTINYGLWATSWGVGTLNIAGFFSAQSSVDNYAIIVPPAEGDVGIGTLTPTETIQIGEVGNVATFKFVDGNETAGHVLTSDANGVGTWQASGGGGGNGIYGISDFVPSGIVATITDTLTFAGGAVVSEFIVQQAAANGCLDTGFTIEDSGSIPQLRVLGDGRVAVGNGWPDTTTIGIVEGSPASTNVSLNLYDIVTSYNKADDCAVDTGMEDNGLTIQKEYAVADSVAASKNAAFFSVNLTDPGADVGNPYHAIRTFASHTGAGDASSSEFCSLCTFTFANTAAATDSLVGISSTIANQGGGGTVDSAYHIRLGAITETSPITNKYGIYQEGADDKNDFAGPMRFRDTSGPGTTGDVWTATNTDGDGVWAPAGVIAAWGGMAIASSSTTMNPTLPPVTVPPQWRIGGLGGWSSDRWSVDNEMMNTSLTSDVIHCAIPIPVDVGPGNLMRHVKVCGMWRTDTNMAAIAPGIAGGELEFGAWLIECGQTSVVGDEGGMTITSLFEDGSTAWNTSLATVLGGGSLLCFSHTHAFVGDHLGCNAFIVVGFRQKATAPIATWSTTADKVTFSVTLLP